MNDEKEDGRKNNVPPVESRFLPGQSGNPGGRPKESISFFIEKFMERPISELIALSQDKEKTDAMTGKEAIAFTQVIKAIEGKELATDRVFDRTEGKAKQVIELYGAEDLKKNQELLAGILGHDVAEPNQPVSS